ncbi:hypothetical protein J2I47_10280 [Fibrella sp. HMF5335]|uniref:Uncharacterized protein n=1 Tax=Fibrella rubiginis TaxID=2817060 RepID=A0A939GEM1_9BACT|nr:hypothetical protein [Fibrella rubiginis]MBO0936931.1 hypothetical protein [Fibrella rubiginis]
MMLTVCTRAQLAGALALGASVRQHHPEQRFIIGLADEPADLPAVGPCTLLTLTDTGLTSGQLTLLSARYTPTEFSAAVKPGFIRTAFERFSDETTLIYLSPTSLLYGPLTPVFNALVTHNVLLNPHWLVPPADGLAPDEKHLQNVGLYSGGCLGFWRDAETERMLAWWEMRCHEHAAVNFCLGSCLDGLWLMHVPTLFAGVGVLKNTGLQAALWNLPQRLLVRQPDGWQVGLGDAQTPLLSVDFLGLTVKNEGLFQHQNRLRLASRSDVRQLLTDYRAALTSFSYNAPHPAYGEQPEPVIRTGWRRTAHTRLTQLSRWIATVPVKPLHR